MGLAQTSATHHAWLRDSLPNRAALLIPEEVLWGGRPGPVAHWQTDKKGHGKEAGRAAAKLDPTSRDPPERASEWQERQDRRVEAHLLRQLCQELGSSLILFQEGAEGLTSGQKAVDRAWAHCLDTYLSEKCQLAQGWKQPRPRVLLHLYVLQD